MRSLRECHKHINTWSSGVVWRRKRVREIFKFVLSRSPDYRRSKKRKGNKIPTSVHKTSSSRVDFKAQITLLPILTIDSSCDNKKPESKKNKQLKFYRSQLCLMVRKFDFQSKVAVETKVQLIKCRGEWSAVLSVEHVMLYTYRELTASLNLFLSRRHARMQDFRFIIGSVQEFRI